MSNDKDIIGQPVERRRESLGMDARKEATPQGWKRATGDDWSNGWKWDFTWLIELSREVYARTGIADAHADTIDALLTVLAESTGQQQDERNSALRAAPASQHDANLYDVIEFALDLADEGDSEDAINFLRAWTWENDDFLRVHWPAFSKFELASRCRAQGGATNTESGDSPAPASAGVPDAAPSVQAVSSGESVESLKRELSEAERAVTYWRTKAVEVASRIPAGAVSSDAGEREPLQAALYRVASRLQSFADRMCNDRSLGEKYEGDETELRTAIGYLRQYARTVAAHAGAQTAPAEAIYQAEGETEEGRSCWVDTTKEKYENTKKRGFKTRVVYLAAPASAQDQVVRDKVLEEAALKCENIANHNSDMDGRTELVWQCAAAIRALRQPSSTSGGEA